MMSVLTILSGSLAIDHQPASGQTILIINADADSILHSGVSDSAGNFSWEFPRELAGTKVFALARFRSAEIITSEYCELTLGDKANFNFNVNSSELESLNVEIKGDKEVPKKFQLHILAVSVNEIPDNLSRFLPMDSQYVDGYYYNRTFDSGIVNLKIKKGTYRINAMYFVLGSTQNPPPPPQNFKTVKAVSNDQPLKGDGRMGFEIDIAATATVTLTMVRSED